MDGWDHILAGVLHFKMIGNPWPDNIRMWQVKRDIPLAKWLACSLGFIPARVFCYLRGQRGNEHNDSQLRNSFFCASATLPHMTTGDTILEKTVKQAEAAQTETKASFTA